MSFFISALPFFFVFVLARLNRDTSIAKKGEWVNKMNNLSSSLIDGFKKNGDANIESEMVDTEFKDLKKNMGQKNYIQLEMNNVVIFFVF